MFGVQNPNIQHFMDESFYKVSVFNRRLPQVKLMILSSGKSRKILQIKQLAKHIVRLRRWLVDFFHFIQQIIELFFINLKTKKINKVPKNFLPNYILFSKWNWYTTNILQKIFPYLKLKNSRIYLELFDIQQAWIII